MALALEGFSIREYVANTRSIDFDKCWPFGGGGGERSLPSISVQKFRFWTNEIKVEEITPVKTPAKGKQRTPKKRSIVELFAAAPPIEAVEVGDGGFDIVEEKDEGRKEKGKEFEIKKKKLMKAKGKKRVKVEICASKKEKKSKATSSAHILHKLKGTKHKVMSRKNSENPDDSKKKSVYKKNLAKNQKLKLLQCSKQISKEKREQGKVLQAHCILKNPIIGTPKNAGAKTNTQADNLIESYLGSEEPTTLLGKDDSLAHSKSCSSVLDDASKGDNLPAANDVAQAEISCDINASRDIVDSPDETFAGKDQLFESHSNGTPPIYTNPRNTSCSDAERASFSISEDNQQSLQACNDGCHLISGSKTLLASDPHNEPRNPESFHSAVLSSHSDIQVKEISPKTSDSRFDLTGSLSFIRNLSPLKATSYSVMRKEENKMQPQPPIDPLTNSYWQILPPKDFRSSVGLKLVPNPVASCKEKCIVEGFVGLPLNSQGELIHSKSGATSAFDEIRRKENVIQGSNSGYSAPHNAKPRTSLDHVNRMKGKFPNATLSQKVQPSWFQGQYSFADLLNFDNYGVQSNNETMVKSPSFLHDHNIMEVSCHSCRDDNRTRNYIDRVNFQAERHTEHVSQPSFQQTMRLMGTNVTVTGNNKGCRSYGDGRMWTDKEVLNGHFPSVLVSDQPMQQQWVTNPPSRTPKNNLVHPLDTSSNFYSMPAIAPKLGLMHFNYRPQWVSRNNTSSTAGSTHSKADLFSYPLNSQSLMNDSSNSILTSNPGITSVQMGHQIHPNSYQHMLLSSTHCKHSQGITYSTTSTFHPPISCHDTLGPIQPSQAQSSMNLPRWLLNAKQQKKSQIPPCSCYPNPIATHHNNNMSCADIFPLQSPHHTSMINFPVCAGTTSKSGRFSTPSFIQSKTATDISSSKNMIRGGRGFNFTYLKSLDTTGKTRKRAAAKDDHFMKPAKKPFFRMQETTALADPRQEQVHINTLQAKTMTGSNNSEVVIQSESLRTLSVSSLKVDAGLRCGPVKLTAGAKHVLKPCQDLDQDNSKTIHSTLPFSIGDNSGKVINPRMKVTEIYRF